MHRLLAGQGLEISQGLVLATPLARITATSMLYVNHRSLLTQAAVVLPGTLLKQLMQRISHITNLQRGHCLTAHTVCMHLISRSPSRGSFRSRSLKPAGGKGQAIASWGSSKRIPVSASGTQAPECR